MSPQEISRMTAEAAVAADTLFNQTGDPQDHLTVVVGPDGMYSTTTLRNAAFQQQTYSRNKTAMEYVLYGAAGLGGLWLLSRIFRR